MKKLISLVLAIMLIVATLTCAMPLAISAAEAPIEATPIVGWTHTGASGITRSEVTPLSAVMANGISATATTAFDLGDGLAGSQHKFVAMNFSEYSLADTEGFIMYIKTDSANQIVFSAAAAGFGYGTANTVEGRSFYTLSKGAASWEAKTITAGSADKFFAAMKFDEAFEGYVKIPYASLGSNGTYSVFNNTYSITQIAFRFRALGGDFGGAVVGPVSTYKADSSSIVIKYPDEFIPSPIEATPIVGWTHNSASGITRSEVTPVKTITANGISVTATTPFDLGDGLAGSQHKFVAMNFSEYSLADTEGFIMYIKTDSDNQIIFSAAAAGFGYGTANTVIGRSFYTLSKGAASWETKTITAGSTDGFFAAMKFDEAFEGYVKIPYASLGSNGTYSVFNNTYSITQIAFRFRALGGDFGGAVVGPVSTYKTDSISTKIVYPDEFKPQPIKAIPLTGFTANQVFDKAYVNLVMPEATKNFVTAEGLKATQRAAAAGPYIPTSSSQILIRMFYANAAKDGYALPADFASKGSFIMYVNVPSANKMHWQFTTTYGANYQTTCESAPNATYEYVAVGGDTWSTATTDENGAFVFDGAFEGYIKVSTSSIKCVDKVIVTYAYLGFMGIRLEGIGGDYGEVIAGPLFVTTDNSASTVITVDEQYKPQPLEIKSFDFREVRASGYNYSADKIEETNNYKLYIDESALSDTPVKHEDDVKKWSYVENADGEVGSAGATALVMTPTVKTYMKDAKGIVFYVKFDKPNKFSPNLIFDTSKSFMLKPGQKVQILANGSDKWIDKTVEIGHGENALIYGMVSFDTAFEGYIKVPFSACNNDGGFKPVLTGDNMSALTSIALRFKGIGDDTMYGSEVIAGVTGYYTEDTTRAAIGTVATPDYAKGDVNYDWKVDSADLVSARKSAMGIAGYAGYKTGVVDIVRIKKILVNS